jgi:hypothetical protein
MRDGNILRWLSRQDLEDIAGRDFTLLFEADHEPADNAVAEIRVENPKDGRTRGRSNHREGLRGVEERPPLRVLVEGKIKNDGTARKVP